MLTMNLQSRKELSSTLDHLEDVINRMKQSLHEVELSASNKSLVTFPFVLLKVINGQFPRPALLDEYWDDLYELFTYNEVACCKGRPESDEVVLHIRGFADEGAEHHRNRELNPIQTAYDFLGHLKAGDKVAVVGRFNNVAQYIKPLEDRGLQVRFVGGQKSFEDFCFLKSATKLIAGNSKSTFVRNAALLSNTVKNVSLYCGFSKNYTCLIILTML